MVTSRNGRGAVKNYGRRRGIRRVDAGPERRDLSVDQTPIQPFPPIRERPITPKFRRMQTALGGTQYGGSMRAYVMGEVRILLSREPFGPGDLRWHISMSCEKRDPTWAEIKHVQNTLKPGIFFCMPMPPAEYWINIHERAYHLEEVKDPQQIEHWKAQRSDTQQGG